MNSQPTFKPDALPTKQSVDSNNFQPDNAPLQSRFEILKNMGMDACKRIKSDWKGLEVAIKGTTLAALRVANENDIKNNHFDYATAANDTPFDDPIARQKLAGTA